MQGIAAVPASITAPRHPGLPARASAGENKPRGRNPALRPGFAARLLRGETKREAQLTLSEAYALPNESRPRSYAGVAPIPRQAPTPPRANAGARQPPRKETRVGNFCFDAGSSASPSTGEEEEGLPALAPLPGVCVHAGLYVADLSRRSREKDAATAEQAWSHQPDQAKRSRHGLSPDTAADHPPPDKKAHGGGLAQHGCYERTASYDRASPKDVGRKNSIICR